MPENKKKTDHKPNEDIEKGNAGGDTANPADSGAVLPDPEELKLPPLHEKDDPDRTVVDVNKPKDNNTTQDNDDPGAWDFRRNK